MAEKDENTKPSKRFAYFSKLLNRPPSKTILKCGRCEILVQHSFRNDSLSTCAQIQQTNGAVQGLEDWREMRSTGFWSGSNKGRKMALNAKTSRKDDLIHEDQERRLDLPLINEILVECNLNLVFTCVSIKLGSCTEV
ncbi:hypothetical protein DFH28DRAFT_137324 [Melampsora americana]|nr:hypothetical protein DFH28DRAFT_137324 [Melampsora americana]